MVGRKSSTPTKASHSPASAFNGRLAIDDIATRDFRGGVYRWQSTPAMTSARSGDWKQLEDANIKLKMPRF
jgi:hypothetical protein